MHMQKLGLLGSAGLGAGLGVGLMYFLDPRAGDHRRAVARKKAVRALRQGAKAARRTSKDLGHRALEILDLQTNHHSVPRLVRRNWAAGTTLGAVGLGLLARGLASAQR